MTRSSRDGGEPSLTTTPDGRDIALVSVQAADLAAPHVRVGNSVVIMTGPRVVADAVVTETL